MHYELVISVWETMLTLLLLFITSLAVGFVSSIVGIGGGSILTPLLTLAFGYDVKVSIATSLLCIVVTSSSASGVYLEKGLVNMKIALLLEPTTVLGAIIGAFITITIPSEIVKGILGIMLLYLATTMMYRVIGSKSKGSKEDGCTSGSALSTPLKREIAAVMISFVAGMLSGMLGIGGGVIKVPLLTLVLGLPLKSAIATSSFMIGLTAAAGSIVYLLKGFIEPFLVAVVASGIMPGAILGAKTMRRLKPRTLSLLLSIILFYSALRLLWSMIG